MEEVEKDPPTCFNYGDIGHVLIFCTKPHTLYRYFYSTEHVTEDCRDLLKKWEERKAHYNMVTTKPRRNQMKDEEVNVWVITQGEVKTIMDFEHGEILGQITEGNIKKVV
jgi:hypothetical protein